MTLTTGPSAWAARPPFRANLRRHVSDIALMPFVAIMALLFVAPSLRMLSRSFLEPSPRLDNYLMIFDSPLYRQVFATTFRVSLVVTLFSIALAFPVAQFVLRCGPLLRSVVFAIVLVPFWTSLLVRVYGWTFLLQLYGRHQRYAAGTGDHRLAAEAHVQ